MQFQFEWLPANPGQVRLKCFYGTDPNYDEFYLVLDPNHRVGEFHPKEGYKVEALTEAFRMTMAGE
jgi:hypothetical protein